jgi:NitT/TauT family transport system permease protein
MTAALSSNGATHGATHGLRRFSGGNLPLLRWSLRAISVLLSLLLWHICSTRHLDLGIVTFANVPTPGETAAAFIDLLNSPKLWKHLGSSLFRVFAGFGAAALFGVAFGLVIGRSRWAEDVLLPPLELLRPIPAVAWIPLAVLMFPSSELSMIFITFVGALFPILLNTIHGVEGIDPRLIATAKSLGTSTLRLFPEVILPGAAPSIVTGLSIGMGTCWFCLVTAEMISGQFGIGHYTWESYVIQKYPDIIVGMFLIGAFGMASAAVLKKLGALLTPWYRLQEKKA